MNYSCKEKNKPKTQVWQLKCKDGICLERGRETEFNLTVSALPAFLHLGLNLSLVYGEKDTRHWSVTEAASFHQTHSFFFLVTS